ncbi:CC0125/CC1285 family lipoprotein [Phenylobacterium aquaticum]|jgi:hypothetical protein|uniref:CC0125/CC1285 family lipoprotein n=1 Tax=Phenylobacterium aquaticum TaxID=1763816 RepID=UPI001F5D0FF0|nr:hypothetical protein [Phenylobacterium aquaticum]MCI3135429.1 hypothetical protein [Phenylobacterium aquaticum]
MSAKVFAALGVGLALTLSACATPTPYQPAGPGQAQAGGFSETKIEANRYRVKFSGNSLTSRDTVEGYLLYRAAELTVAQGYDVFSVVERKTDKSTQTYVDPDPMFRPWYGPGYGYWRPSWRYYGAGFGWRSWDPIFGGPFWGDSLDIHTVDRFEATAEIVMSKGPKAEGDASAFDARAVMANLSPKIQRPPVK